MSFLRQITDAPILFLTAKTTDYDKLTGFAVGGDDYVVKPFNPLEVVARIKSLLNRYLPSKASNVQQNNQEYVKRHPLIHHKGYIITVVFR